jgi:hypothetical protein
VTQARITVTVDGKSYSTTAESLFNLTIGECRVIKRECGMTTGQWIDTLEMMAKKPKRGQKGPEMDETVLAILMYLLRSRAGEPVTWADVEAMRILDIADGLSVTEESDTPAPVAAVG